MRTRTVGAGLALTCTTLLSTVAVANAAPPEFPDVDSYPAVVADDYYRPAPRPSGAGWAFTTPGGLFCFAMLITEAGLSCHGPIPGAGEGADTVSASLTRPGELSITDTPPPDVPEVKQLPTGSKFAPNESLVCAVPTDDTLACRLVKPASWPAADPPDRHYAEHGFVVQPSGSWTY